jgi:predicted tellurium resistance membrane protein TerC
MELSLTPDLLIAFLTLCFLEIILGIDNIIFISLLTNKLPEEQRSSARTAGIGLALVFRVAMLLGITWIIGLTKPLFTLMDHDVTGRDMVLFLGGIFLIWKSTSEIHHKVADDQEEHGPGKVAKSFLSAIIQIGLIDIVFSFDSILTAIGMTENLTIMIAAVIVSLLVMLLFAGRIASFIEKYPTLQILALSFLILIGTVLIADAAGFHVPKGYIYFAVAFSLGVETLNLRIRKPKVKK